MRAIDFKIISVSESVAVQGASYHENCNIAEILRDLLFRLELPSTAT